MNISDIAKLAGVAPSTVSRYLNNGYVSKEKKEIIAKVIEETGYAPLAAAQSLKNRKIRTIGVIVPRINSESVGHMVDGITKRFEGTEYEILLGNTDNDIDRETEYLNFFENNLVDGVIFLATKLNKKQQKILNRYNKPIVIATQNIPHFACVYNDDFGAAYQATKHLIDQGCKKIVYLGVTEDDIAAGHERHEGFRKALKESNLEPAYEKEVDFSVFEGYTGINDAINLNVDFDGVFCATDNIAAGVLNNLSFTDLKIPEDVKIIGIGDSVISKAMIPSLTSVHLYYDELGFEAADMIINYLSNDLKIDRQTQLGFELCVRQSTEKNEP